MCLIQQIAFKEQYIYFCDVNSFSHALHNFTCSQFNFTPDLKWQHQDEVPGPGDLCDGGGGGDGDDPELRGALHPRLAQHQHDEQGQDPLLHEAQCGHQTLCVPVSSSGGSVILWGQ